MKFISIIASAVLFPQGLFASRFSKKQLEVAQWAYAKGKPHGFPETLRAIAWQESSFGINLENKGEGSCGIFGNRADIAQGRLVWAKGIPTYARIKETAHRLKEDRDFAAEMAIEELKFWQARRKNWDDVIKSYNAGYKMENGEKYLKEIRAKMKILKGMK